jgi:hypothetical protein
MGKTEQARSLYGQYYLHGGKPVWYYLAAVDLSLNRPDDAVRDLEKAFEERLGDAIWTGADPKFDELRSNPRFRRLLASMNLSAK